MEMPPLPSGLLSLLLICAQILSCVRPFATPCQAPLSMGILQARILEWVAMPSSRGSSQPRDWTHVSYVFCTGRWILYHWAIWEAHLSTFVLGCLETGPGSASGYHRRWLWSSSMRSAYGHKLTSLWFITHRLILFHWLPWAYKLAKIIFYKHGLWG